MGDSTFDHEWQELLDRVVAGEQEAAIELWEQYGGEMLRLAEQRVVGDIKRRVGPSDVVNSAFRSFLRHAEDGAYQLPSDNSLRRLLREITLNKVRQYIRFHLREKRSVNREATSEPSPSDTSPDLPSKLPDRYPTQFELSAAMDLRTQLQARLEPDEVRVLELKLEGLTNQEIAERLRSSERTIRRIVQRIRKKLEDLTDDSA